MPQRQDTPEERMALREMLQEETYTLCDNYNVIKPVVVYIYIRRNSHTAGYVKWYEDKHYKIWINFAYYLAFGLDQVVGTLYHEFAHVLSREMGFDRCESSHGPMWKKLCVKLGGTMNSQLAGMQYADHIGNYL